MNVDLISSSHSIGESNLHLQVTPAYRCKIFEDDMTRILTRDYLLSAGRRMKAEITAIGFGKDHVHIFIRNWKNFAIKDIAKLLKGFSSRMMRKYHSDLFKEHLWGKKFWSAGYFYRTVGAINSETVKKYVAESQEYGYKGSELPNQKKLIEFSV